MRLTGAAGEVGWSGPKEAQLMLLAVKGRARGKGIVKEMTW
jgi:ribosomal protein S18 acetylase RimI-like enzyme